MKLRILQTLSEMIKEPRINGVVLIFVVPTLVSYFTHLDSPNCLKGTLIIGLILFLFCFLVVRFSLDL